MHKDSSCRPTKLPFCVEFELALWSFGRIRTVFMAARPDRTLYQDFFQPETAYRIFVATHWRFRDFLPTGPVYGRTATPVQSKSIFSLPWVPRCVDCSNVTLNQNVKVASV